MARRSDRESAYERLVGVEPSEDVVRASRRRLETMLREQFEEAEARRDARRDTEEGLLRPFRDQMRENEEHAGHVRGLRQRAARLAGTRLHAPEVPRAEGSRIILGSIGATVGPPYTWPWTWSATNGSPNPPDVAADNNKGTMHVNLYDDQDSGAASGAAALGIFFRPAIQNIGILQVTASPAFNYRWWTYNAFDSSHSDGWIGIYIGEYTLDGTQYTHVDQRTTLWSEDHNFLSSPDGSQSSSGFPLNAATFVNSESFYELWVWCGGGVAADGDHTFYGSYAGGQLSVSLPFMHWELWG